VENQAGWDREFSPVLCENRSNPHGNKMRDTKMANTSLATMKSKTEEANRNRQTKRNYRNREEVE